MRKTQGAALKQLKNYEHIKEYPFGKDVGLALLNGKDGISKTEEHRKIKDYWWSHKPLNLKKKTNLIKRHTHQFTHLTVYCPSFKTERTDLILGKMPDYIYQCVKFLI